MGNTAIVGINWGDEGKGRMVDLLTEEYVSIFVIIPPSTVTLPTGTSSQFMKPIPSFLKAFNGSLDVSNQIVLS